MQSHLVSSSIVELREMKKARGLKEMKLTTRRNEGLEVSFIFNYSKFNKNEKEKKKLYFSWTQIVKYQ